jgi:signal transduction histidine kinase
MLQTESALNQTLSAEEYKKVLHSLKEDQQNLIDLTNSLLTLSRYETITNIKDWTLIRVDEIIYQTVDFVNQVWPETIVSVDFAPVPENEEDLIFKGNESLIRSAIQNLLKNAIQYSEDQRVNVVIDASAKDGVTLKIDNVGKQLTADEQSRLFIPFFRGENSTFKKGYGLGLSIVVRIINCPQRKNCLRKYWREYQQVYLISTTVNIAIPITKKIPPFKRDNNKSVYQ